MFGHHTKLFLAMEKQVARINVQFSAFRYMVHSENPEKKDLLNCFYVPFRSAHFTSYTHKMPQQVMCVFDNLCSLMVNK